MQTRESHGGEAGKGTSVASSGDSNRTTGMEIQRHNNTAVCCENQLYPVAELSYCGEKAFNPEEATCCPYENGSTITEGLSEKVSACCGLKAYDQLNQICCHGTILVKPGPNAQCCDKKAFDVDEQMCCGPLTNKTILTKESSDHRCCGQNSFNPTTQCCCSINESLSIWSKDSSCCEKADCGQNTYNTSDKLCCQSTVVSKNVSNAQCCGKQAFNNDTQLCCGPSDDKIILERISIDHLCCGRNRFDTNKECCCLTKEGLQIQQINSSCRRDQGQSSDATAVFNPHIGVCCGRCVSDWNPSTDQLHGPPGQHSCRTKVYRPHAGIICDGPRTPHFCGSKAYDIKDPGMKCCAGTLHNLTQVPEAQCCGSILQNKPNVCCLSEHMEVLYSNKTKFECCGHLYYNTSLWSCCAGTLSAVPPRGQHPKSILRSLGNLNETDLCGKLQVGIVERDGLNGIVFNSVLIIHGRNGSVIPRSGLHTLSTGTDGCSNAKLVPGKSYFFDDVKVNVFTDLNHDSILQSIYFIISKCHTNI
nr:uncharacterized protein si:ch211-195m9.3 isoform X2 [Gasterosteus aculeatus aculeatus]